jgi:hypothetical protein
MTPKRLTSMGRDRSVLDMSATSGTSPVSGTKWNSTPPIVSLGV